MSVILDISIDPRNLIATISLNEKNERIINELKIILSNLSENYTYQDRNFTIPWFELRRGLSGLAHVRRREGIILRYSDFAKSLVQEVIFDRRNIKDKKSAIKIDETELLKILAGSGFYRPLKEEQKRDAIKLLTLKHGANFSVPGAGKTATILAVHTILKKFKIVTKLFVIAPINAFTSWQDEINEIFRDKTFSIHRLQTSEIEDFSSMEKIDANVILVNYEKMRRDIKDLMTFFTKHKVHLILDESHRVKAGTNNMSFSQIIKLADLAKRRDILSGTPMPQSYIDLESQFDFLWPGERIIPDQIKIKDEEKVITKVNQAIDGLFVRTTKNELGLKDPCINYNTIPMGPIQAELYHLFKSETARLLAGLDKPNMYNFRRIGRSVVKLLQAASNPILLTTKDDYDEDILPVPNTKAVWELLEDFQKYEKPVKIEFLIKRVNEIIEKESRNKVLIWSYFVRNILILEKLLKNFNPVIIYGGVPSGDEEDERNREGRIRKFHDDPNCRVMIANPQACGEGISLHKICHNAIYLDRNFNAAYYLQSIDRIHRLGLDKEIDTRIEILITENSIDEILINRLNDKIKLMGNILDDPYLNSLAYDPSDIPIEDEMGLDANDIEAIKEHVSKR